MVKAFFDNGLLLKEIFNHTYITLIPKTLVLVHSKSLSRNVALYIILEVVVKACGSGACRMFF